MTATDDTHYTIKVPKLDGYKTLAVNAVLVVLGLVALFKPGLVLPTPEALGLAYDQFTGLVVMVVGVVNGVLRLMTKSPPAAPVNLLKLDTKLKPDDPRIRHIVNQAYEWGRARGLADAEDARAMPQPQDLASAYANDARRFASMTRAEREATANLFAADRAANPLDRELARSQGCAHDWTPAGVCRWCGTPALDEVAAHEAAHSCQQRPGPDAPGVAALLAFLAPTAVLCVLEASQALARALT